jgi:hypothetical protein
LKELEHKLLIDKSELDAMTSDQLEDVLTGIQIEFGNLLDLTLLTVTIPTAIIPALPSPRASW